MRKMETTPALLTTYSEFEKQLAEAEKGGREELLQWVSGLSPRDLEIRHISGWSVAHSLAFKKLFPVKLLTPDILRMESGGKCTVAHIMGENGTLPEEAATPDILNMRDSKGRTVMSKMADGGALPRKLMTEENLLLPEDYYSNRIIALQLFEDGFLPPECVTPEIARAYCGEGETFIQRAAVFLERYIHGLTASELTGSGITGSGGYFPPCLPPGAEKEQLDRTVDYCLKLPLETLSMLVDTAFGAEKNASGIFRLRWKRAEQIFRSILGAVQAARDADEVSELICEDGNIAEDLYLSSRG